MATKICCHCRKEKELRFFNKDTHQKDNKARTCKNCRSQERLRLKSLDPERYRRYSEGYRLRNPEKVAENLFVRRHKGFSKKEVLLLVEEQNGCKICGSKTPGGSGNWHIDHDHNCCPQRESCENCRRGVLCNACNLMLGFAKDNVSTLQKAIQYLEEYERKFV